MSRYRSFGKLDDATAEEGDRGFIGMNSYLEPSTLEPGFVEDSQNMRLEGDTAKVRKGIEFKAGSVTLSYASDEKVFTSILFSDPATNAEFIAVATKNKVIIWNDQNNSGIDIAYPGGEVVAAGDNASFVQAAEKLILFRGPSKTPLEWTGDYSTPTAFTVKANGSPGAGNIACPNTTFGVFFANRLLIPQPADSKFTVLASEILDTDNYKESTSQFRLSKGSASGGIVAITSYLENQAIIFQRNSIFLINNIALTASAATFEITRQFGCVARKSVAASGPQIYFLSDDGVMVLQQGLDAAKGLGISVAKVSGEAVPLTRPIQDQIDQANFANADKAVGVTFDNKYFLAYPGSPTSTTNDKCIVFDILQNNFSSIDSFPSGFAIDDFVIIDHGTNPTKRRLFACNDKGWHLIEEAATDITGTIGSGTTTSTAISAKLKTRSFTLGDMNVKSWKRGQLGVKVNNGDAFTIKYNTTDPDRTNTVHTESYSGSAEEKLIRFGSGRARGFACGIEVDVTAGSPEIRHVTVEGIKTGLMGRHEVA